MWTPQRAKHRSDSKSQYFGRYLICTSSLNKFDKKFRIGEEMVR